ncbi:hypothetical protein [Bradyrhizobium sp.]|uniref:hypothetical protein n=1 Tax=Bradyrhizobium sp. TaxID=376 RepID=UPI003BAFA998
MAPLKNQRRETFARKIIEAAKRGLPQTWAYEQSGYRTLPGHVSEVAASRLLSTVEVQQRIAELSEPATRRAKISVESLLAQLEATVTGATKAKQFGAVNGSLALIGKLTGLLRDQIEIGSVGQFDQCQTMPELVEALLANESPAQALQTLDTLRQAIELHAATHAAIVVPRHMMPSDETAMALAMFRPGRKDRRN